MTLRQPSGILPMHTNASRNMTSLLVASILLMAGCSLDTGVRFSLPFTGNCSRSLGLDDLSALGPASSTQELECGLTLVRTTHNPELLRSAIGSRIALHLAERNENAQQRESLAHEGVRLAEQALSLGSARDAAVHYYLATNLGLAVHDHPVEAAHSLQRLETEALQAVQLNPDLDGGGPMRLLGMLYLKAPAWPAGMGDGDKALDLLKQAVDKHPDHPLNQLFYAQALWEVEGESVLPQTRAACALGLERLEKGNWGFNRVPWRKEFAAFSKELNAD